MGVLAYRFLFLIAAIGGVLTHSIAMKRSILSAKQSAKEARFFFCDNWLFGIGQRWRCCGHFFIPTAAQSFDQSYGSD
jgi:hypothetical protein